jgi:hypothetical protein
MTSGMGALEGLLNCSIAARGERKTPCHRPHSLRGLAQAFELFINEGNTKRGYKQLPRRMRDLVPNLGGETRYRSAFHPIGDGAQDTEGRGGSRLEVDNVITVQDVVLTPPWSQEGAIMGWRRRGTHKSHPCQPKTSHLWRGSWRLRKGLEG